MIKAAIPGLGDLCLEHLVLDFNGTLAADGALLPGVSEALVELSHKLILHVVTGDTHGTAATALEGLPLRLNILPPTGQDAAKLDYVTRLGATTCAAIGNGRNDRLMVRVAALGICVLQEEGAAAETLTAAAIVCPDILAGLFLLLKPQRLIATLRS